MHGRLVRRCHLGLVVLLLAASVVGARAPRLGDSMSPIARTYLAKALQLIQEHAVHRDEIDWGKVRRTAFSRAKGARAPADTYFAIRGALDSLKVNGHSMLIIPVANDNGSVQVLDPEFDFGGRKLPGGIGYLSLPGEGGGDAAAEAYVEQGRAAVTVADRGGACGWVIDLRRNTGGNMWPMLAVAGPILGNGKAGAFVYTSGETEPWVIEDGAPLVPRSPGPPPWSPLPPITHANPPVAVLTDSTTASAGEAVTIAFRGRPHTRSFGAPTNGVPTSNTVFTLSDGALLAVTNALEADRTGRTYTAAIPPDVRIEDDDAVLAAATEWLRGQPSCR